MITKFYFWCIIILGIMTGCHNESEQITKSKDYSMFLTPIETTALSFAESERNFWQKRITNHPEQVHYLSPLASAYSSLYEDNGNIKNLLKAEELLQTANEKTLFKNAGLLRALARVYISRHRFKESLTLLEKADVLGGNRQSTRKMMFDVNMELGNYDQAKKSLYMIEKKNSFDYLIRISKWMDHQGDLDSAIHYMTSAIDFAEKSGNKHLICWSYSNLADYYGHAGKINKAYNLYLKVLDVNPKYVYALRGIAWIAFSHDKNIKEASRIINAIEEIRMTPDLLLFKAELAEFNGELIDKTKTLQQYRDMLDKRDYKAMYNKYDVLLYAEDIETTEKALEIALEEVKNRPTPQSYDLLAWVYYNNGDQMKSLEVIQQYVVNQTFDPESEFHQAIIYKANGLHSEAKEIKERLLKNNIFELGPNIQRKIESL